MVVASSHHSGKAARKLEKLSVIDGARERDRLVQCAYSISTNIIVNGGEEQCVVVEDSLIESTDNHWLVSHACLINA